VQRRFNSSVLLLTDMSPSLKEAWAYRSMFKVYISFYCFSRGLYWCCDSKFAIHIYNYQYQYLIQYNTIYHKQTTTSPLSQPCRPLYLMQTSLFPILQSLDTLSPSSSLLTPFDSTPNMCPREFRRWFFRSAKGACVVFEHYFVVCFVHVS
jgi:hypothetical protein